MYCTPSPDAFSGPLVAFSGPEIKLKPCERLCLLESSFYNIYGLEEPGGLVVEC